MRGRKTWLLIVPMLLVTAALTWAAADVNKLLTEADGRKRAAENGLRDIKKKSAEQANGVKGAYTDAATKNNAWVDAVAKAIQDGGATAPDVKFLADPASSSLVDWVKMRNSALGVGELTPLMADAAKKSIVANLNEIATEAWKSNKGGSQDKRTKAATGLKDRLHWRSFDEVQ